MALPSWPILLPPLVAPVGVAKADELVPAPLETEFDDGPPRSRRRRLHTSTTRAMALTLTRSQFSTFLAFLRDDLSTGARRFTAPVRLSTGNLGIRTCKIVGKVAEDDRGPRSVVSFNLLIFGW